MEPLNLLIVSIKKGWQPLIADSLRKAGYNFHVKYVESKHCALEACHQAKFDLVISNCTLPDGQVADLVSVLGKLVPCLVMSEGICPVTSGNALSLLATDFYITNSEQTSWLTAMENALAKWKANAQLNIDEYYQNNSSLHKKVLARCQEELSGNIGSEKETNHSIGNVLTILLEVLDLSRIYLYTKNFISNGEEEIIQKNEVSAPGVTNRKIKSSKMPYFNRWNTLFTSKKPVLGVLSSLPAKERQWFNQRDTQSLLAVPIHNDITWNGFIGLEDTMNPRQWSDAEVNLMISVAGLISEKQQVQLKSPRLNKGSLFSSQV